MEVLREESTVYEIALKYGISPVMVSRWKKEFLERAPEIFKKGLSYAEKELKKKQHHVAELECKDG